MFVTMNAMNQPAIETPCIKICVVDPETGFCIGCGSAAVQGLEAARTAAAAALAPGQAFHAFRKLRHHAPALLRR